jgi:hypothetical protein
VALKRPHAYEPAGPADATMAFIFDGLAIPQDLGLVTWTRGGPGLES